MQINREYEQKTGLKDLCFHVLYRWRSILLAAVLCAVAFGAYQAIRLAIVHGAGERTTEEAQYEIDYERYYSDKAMYETNIANHTVTLNHTEEYLQNSVYINLDFSNYTVLTRWYFVQSVPEVLAALPDNGNTQDPADYVLSTYVTMLKGNLDRAEMERLFGTGELRYVDELVSVEVDYATNMFSVSIAGDDETMIRQQMDWFVTRLETTIAQKAQSISAHTLVSVDESVSTVNNLELLNQQKEYQQTIADLQTRILNNKEKLLELAEEQEPTAPGTHIKKYAAVGFLAGAFVLAAVYAFQYLFNGRLKNLSEMQEHFGLPVYGNLNRSRARRPGKGIDRLIETWEFGGTAVADRIIYDNIGALIKENCADCVVLLTGTGSEKNLKEVQAALSEKLGSTVTLKAQPNFLINEAAIAEAKQADAVVLVEERYMARLKQIERMVEVLQIGGANVIGSIIL